jgi:hypothetical protein
MTDLVAYSTDAAVVSLGSQVTFILGFFLYRNIRIARDRAWVQTVASRGKGPEFWQPYVEECEVPPFVDESRRGLILKAFTSVGGFILKKCEPASVVRHCQSFLMLTCFLVILFPNPYQSIPYRRYIHIDIF